MRIEAILKKIISSDNLNLLEFEAGGEIINVLILQNNLNLKVNEKAFLTIKPTKLFLSKDKFNFENRLKVRIKNIKEGKILASIVCDFSGFELEVLMLKKYVNFSNEAYLYFKSSDVSIEVFND